MTIQGAIYELNNMLSSNDIPFYWKPAIKKIIETVEQNVREMSEQTDGDLISRTNLLKDIADLKKSPWFNDGKDIKDLFRHNSYVTRKEAVEIIEDLCIKKLPSAEKTAESEEE